MSKTPWKTENWHTSPWNFAPEVTADWKFPEKIQIHDVTLRDGEQSPGATMNLEEKMQIAEILEEMKVDIIEAGFPIASNGDFEAVLEISKNIKNSTIAGLARAKLADIDRAGEAVKNAKSSRIHTFIATSPVHMK